MTPETMLKRSIKEYLSALGINHFYFLQGMGGYHGLPDMAFFDERDKKLVFVEVKTPKGKMSEHQIKFQNMVKPYDVKHLVVRNIDEIIDYLK